jgi:hypothetical protein
LIIFTEANHKILKFKQIFSNIQPNVSENPKMWKTTEINYYATNRKFDQTTTNQVSKDDIIVDFPHQTGAFIHFNLFTKLNINLTYILMFFFCFKKKTECVDVFVLKQSTQWTNKKETIH